MRRRRAIGISVALIALLVFVASGVRMARAVSEHYRTHARELFVFQPIEDRHFTFAGREVAIQDGVGDAGQLIVRLTYGDDSVTLTPTIRPGPAELPGLERHNDWLRVMQIAPARGMTQARFNERLASGEINARLVALVRRPPLGADERTYAKVWRTDWRYEFHELWPEGGIGRQILRHPTGDEPPAPDELVPGTWQFEAALGSWGFDPMSVVAPHASPSAASAREALEASGLALPLASLSLLVFVGALAIAFAPSRAVSEGTARRANRMP
jgi:hypothetical protein